MINPISNHEKNNIIWRLFRSELLYGKSTVKLGLSEGPIVEIVKMIENWKNQAHRNPIRAKSRT